MTFDSVLVQDMEPVAADLEGDVVLLSLRGGCYFGLNQVASEIWRLLAEPRAVRQIFELLSEWHEVDETTLARDVPSFLQTLIEQKLVRVVENGTAR